MFLDALFDANKWDISNYTMYTQNNCLLQDTNKFFLSNLWTKMLRNI